MRTIIVTRPTHQATPWVDGLRSHGFHVKHIPLLRISPYGEKTLIEQAWSNIEHWTWIMFVSPNAAHYFFQYANNKKWPPHVRAGSPGEGTTQNLIQLGIPSTLIDQPESHQEKDTDFLWHNIKDRNWKTAQVLLVRGKSAKPNRDNLMIQLQEAGAFVQPLVVYQRESGIFSNSGLSWLHSEKAKQACWIISSSESLTALKDYDCSEAIAIVIHPRIAKAAREAGFGQVIHAQPSLNSLLDAVESVV